MVGCSGCLFLLLEGQLFLPGLKAGDVVLKFADVLFELCGEDFLFLFEFKLVLPGIFFGIFVFLLALFKLEGELLVIFLVKDDLLLKMHYFLCKGLYLLLVLKDETVFLVFKFALDFHKAGLTLVVFGISVLQFGL